MSEKKIPDWFMRAMAALAILPRPAGMQLGENAVELYWRLLRDIPEPDLQRGLAACLKAEKFFPVPATIRERAGATVKALDPGTRARVAWHGVLETMGRHGAHHSIDFGPLVNRVIAAMGGWPYLCGLGSEELRKWRVKEFTDLFMAYEQAGGDGPAHLPGIVEQENAARGYLDYIPEPERVALPGVADQAALSDGKKALTGGRS